MELRDYSDRTHLIIAAERGHAEMVEWLLDKGADPEAQDDGRGGALHRACQHGHTAVVSLLVDRGFDTNRRAHSGWVPLMIAALRGNVAVVEILLSRKEIQIDRQDDDGWTALWYASRYNHPEVIGLLLPAGEDPRIATNHGRTALDTARAGGYEECIQLLEVSK